MPTTTTRTGYCKKCGYDLRATEGRCPECGREFDWNNRKTFRRKPLGRGVWKRIGKVAGAAVLLAVIALGIIVGPDYWEWRKNQHAAEVITNAGGSVQFGRLGPPPQWTHYLGHRWDYLGERLIYVQSKISGQPSFETENLTDAELRELRACVRSPSIADK